MGNHAVGQSMTMYARGFWRGHGEQPPPSKDEALALLDEAAEDFLGADAEFDDELNSCDTPLGRLVAIAFEWVEGDVLGETVEASEEEIETAIDDANNAWFEGPVAQFSERYKFC